MDYIIHSPHNTRAQSHRAFSDLTLVCKFFRAIVVPHLFHSLDISRISEKNGNNVAPFNNTAFSRSLLAGDKSAVFYATFIRSVTLQDWLPDHLSTAWTIPAFLCMYGKAFKRMPHLHSLQLSRVSVDRPLLKAICALERLTSLCFADCSFDLVVGSPTGPNFISALSPLRLKEFSFSTSSDPEPFILGLLRRTIDLENLEQLVVLHSAVAEVILSWIPENNVLKRLEIGEIKDVAVLWTALERCKGLEWLEVRHLNGDPAVRDSLPALCLPALRKVVSLSPVLLRLVKQVA